MRMQKILLTSVIVFGITGICAHANANISANAESAGCNNDTIGASSGNTTLEAQWQANQINISWYDGDDAITPSNEGAGQCTYDQAITLPSNTLAREGYTFDGWTVRAVSVNPFANLDVTIPGVQSRNCAHGYRKNTDYCNVALEQVDCSNSCTVNLQVNEFSQGFSYGVVYGTSKCVAKVGDQHSMEWDNDSSNWLATENEIMGSAKGKYCWCKATGFQPDGGDIQNISTTSWLFVYDMWYDAYCEEACSQFCASAFQARQAFREKAYPILATGTVQ